MSVGKNYSTANLFPQIMALSISNLSLKNCYSEIFTVNSYFPLKMQKFSPADVFPYTIFKSLRIDILEVLLTSTKSSKFFLSFAIIHHTVAYTPIV